MDGKQAIKIMSKVQLIATLKFAKTEELKQKKTSKFSTRKRGSTPLISTSISTQRKSNNQSNTLRKVPMNNFMTATTNIMSLTSAKRLSQCQTAIPMRHIRREDNVEKTEAQKLLLKNSDKIHRLLWNEANQTLPPIIISADFIMDQDLFWSSPRINNNINKQWKDLHKNYFVIWVVKLQKSFKMMKDYCQINELPLNSIYYHKRQSRFTIDFTPLRKQINKIYGHGLGQIKYIESLKVNTRDICQSKSFLGRVPIMLDSRLKVCYLRCEQSAQGLEKVLALSKNPSSISQAKIIELKSIPIFVQNNYQAIAQQKRESCQVTRATTIFQRCQTQQIDEEQAQMKVEQFKRQLIETVIKEKGRNFQHEGFSVHYFVGDIIKRNYDLLLQSAMKRSQKKTKQNVILLNKGLRCEEKGIEIEQKFFQYYI